MPTGCSGWPIATSNAARATSRTCLATSSTAPAIEGPWSDPFYLNSSGFDPSLFHDDDGRKWVVNLVWDHRARPSKFGGIVLQEYDAQAGKLVGPVTNIFRGSPLSLSEGPHLYRRGDYYYLITAEGGTSYRHAVSMARSRSITGPYELHPDWHVVTSRLFHEAGLQRCERGDFVETPAGGPHVVHLCGRPIPGLKRCPLGRETAIQHAHWHDDGWLRLCGVCSSRRCRFRPRRCAHPSRRGGAHDFDRAGPAGRLQWLRMPERIFSLGARPGYLRRSAANRWAAGSSRRWSPGARRRSPTTRKRSSKRDRPTTSRWPA